MKQKRAERIMEALKEMGLRQMLIVDPMSIYYLTGVYVEPFERFYALYLREDGKHVYFLNKLFTVPEDVGVEKVWYSDTDLACYGSVKCTDKTCYDYGKAACQQGIPSSVEHTAENVPSKIVRAKPVL